MAGHLVAECVALSLLLSSVLDCRCGCACSAAIWPVHVLHLGAPAYRRPSCRYLANESPGTKLAKLRLLQQRGWVVLPLQWVDK